MQRQVDGGAFAGVAFDLWNEVEVGEGNGHVDEDNLVVQAFARFA